MAINIDTLKVKGLRAVGDRVLVKDMYFGEQKTASGLILQSDDGKTRGIYPRWGRVYAKGPSNNDEYEVGHWILIEHGRWTRAMKVETESDGEFEVRMVDPECILAYADEKPDGVQLGKEYADGEHATVDPSSFVNPN
jgi:co-chaperonin GroES (HSP10)